MEEVYMSGLFALAGIDVLEHRQIDNKYWPESYTDLRRENPWWVVKTRIGLVEIGFRKNVISIDWSNTGIRKIVTSEEVTKCETMVHAWSTEKAVEYLRQLASEISPNRKKGMSLEALKMSDNNQRPETVAVPSHYLERLEEARKNLYAMFPDADTAMLTRLQHISGPMWDLTHRKFPAAATYTNEGE